MPQVGVIQALFQAVGQEMSRELAATIARAVDDLVAIESLFRGQAGLFRRDRQADGNLTVVLFADLAAVLAADAHRMPAFRALLILSMIQ